MEAEENKALDVEEQKQLDQVETNQYGMIIAGSILGLVAFVAGIGFCVRHDEEGKKKWGENLSGLKPSGSLSKGYMKVRQDRFTAGVF